MNSTGKKNRQSQILFRIENRKLRKKIGTMRNGVQVTEDMLNDIGIESSIDKIRNLLPKTIRFQSITFSSKNTNDYRNSWRSMPFSYSKDDLCWFTCDQSVNFSLTQEIANFLDYVKLSELETLARRLVIYDITSCVQSKWPEATVNAFGSFSANISTFLSDLDFSILNIKNNDSTNSTANTNNDQSRDNNNSCEISDSNDIDIFKSYHESNFTHQSINADNVPVSSNAVPENNKNNITTTTANNILTYTLQENNNQNNASFNTIVITSKKEFDLPTSTTKDSYETLTSTSADEDELVLSKYHSDQQHQNKKQKLSAAHEDAYVSSNSDQDNVNGPTIINTTTLLESHITTESVSSFIKDVSNGINRVITSVATDATLATTTTETNTSNFNNDEDQTITATNATIITAPATRNNDTVDTTTITTTSTAVTTTATSTSTATTTTTLTDTTPTATPTIHVSDWMSEFDYSSSSESDSEDYDNYRGNKKRSYTTPTTPSYQHTTIDSMYNNTTNTRNNNCRIPQQISFHFTDTTSNNSNMDATTTSATVDNPEHEDSSQGRRVYPRKGKHGEREKTVKGEAVESLSTLFAIMRGMGWATEAAELRAKARVPIISLVHSTGVSCDVSIGLTAQDTSDQVRQLMATHPRAFLCLSAFLKCFLWSHGLDKPFTGGIGSFKLYVMIAIIIQNAPPKALHNPDIEGSVDLGFLLLSFFKYFSRQDVLCPQKSLKIAEIEVDLSSITEAHNCRKCFQRAYNILLSSTNTSSSSSSSIETPSLVTSYLARIISCRKLNKERFRLLSLCKAAVETICPLKDPPDELNIESLKSKRFEIAEIILAKLISKLQIARQLTLLDIAHKDPLLANRINSFSTINSVLNPPKTAKNPPRKYENNIKPNNKNSDNGLIPNSNRPTFLCTGVVGSAFQPKNSIKKSNSKKPKRKTGTTRRNCDEEDDGNNNNTNPQTYNKAHKNHMEHFMARKKKREERSSGNTSVSEQKIKNSKRRRISS